MPAKHEKPPTPQALTRGQPTAPRYSFADERLHREDTTAYPEGDREVAVKSRLLTYYSKKPSTREIRDRIAQKGLLLGYEKEEVQADLQAFIIPNSSRPIVHDRSVRGQDSYSYGDDPMFLDLGRLLKVLASEGGEQPYVMNGDLGSNIAFVDFTKPEEPNMLLVPGFENYVERHNGSYDDLLNQYAVRIHNEFDDRFIHSADKFIEGFSS